MSAYCNRRCDLRGPPPLATRAHGVATAARCLCLQIASRLPPDCLQLNVQLTFTSSVRVE